MKSPCCAPESPRNHIPPPAPAQAAEADQTGMIRLEGGSFLMGSESADAWPQDGEGPVREVIVPAFWLSVTAVTNAEFTAFVAATDHRTEAERFGWSFVHHSQLGKSQQNRSRHVPGLEWWCAVDGADWRHPSGDERENQSNHPVVHVSWNDATAYAAWRGVRLPSEAEWEFAARGGLEQKTYPWGDELTPGGRHRCNIWQGDFPKRDTGADGYRGTAPARSFEANGHGIYNMTGNVWEWVDDWFHISQSRPHGRSNLQGPPTGDRRVMRGGSYLCHESYCNRYRCSARSSNTPDSSAGNVGFRCASS